MEAVATPPRRQGAGTRSSASCSHCGLPVVGDVPDGQLAFCCSGCACAYELIHGAGLDQYYVLRSQATSSPVSSTGDSYEEMDDPVFMERYVRSTGATRIVEYYLPGVHCAACVWLLEKLPELVSGVLSVRVNLNRGLASIEWLPETVRLSQIARTLEAMGYPPHIASAEGKRSARQQENRRHLVRLAVAGACAGNSMLLAIALYAGAFTGMADEHAYLLRLTSALLGVISLVWPGSVFFAGAMTSLRTRTPHMDLPVALGLAVGGVAGVVSTVRGSGEIYFDSLTTLVFLLLVGRYLQFVQQRRAADRVSMLAGLTPKRAHRWDGTEFRDVAVESLGAGDLIESRAGESLPADGVVREGESSLDLSLLTGESIPARVAVGSAVPAGATNLSAPLRVEVTAAGEDSRLARILRLMEEGSSRRPPVVQLADGIAGWFVVVVVVLALATFLAWTASGKPGAVEHTIALLIVACPCALGLATPLAVAVAQGRAARQSLLIKGGGDTIERLSRPGRVWLDKTGTLTEGRLRVVRWVGDAEVIPWVASLERSSTHPIARALADESAEHLPVTSVQQDARGGISGVVRGRFVSVGSERYLQRLGVSLGGDWPAEIQRGGEDYFTPILVAVDGEMRALAFLGDQIRPEAAATVRTLRDLGWHVGILSGDHRQVVDHVARSVGIDRADAYGELTPEEKLARVEESTAQESTVMVGDGVNDCAALAAASVGIAVHGGAEASMHAADVYIARPGLTPILMLLAGSRRALGVIYWNFAMSLAYNILAVVLAMAGLIGPLTAALLMPLSSLTVLVQSFAAKTFEEPS